MTEEYENIINNLMFSYSNLTLYNTCPYSWKLTYLDKKERCGNAFSDFGNLCHKILEMFFRKKISIKSIVPWYEKHYSEYVQSPWPDSSANAANNYYYEGLKFFSDFKFNINNYDILFLENYIKYNHNDIKILIKPDVVLRNKNTKLVILVDFKTSKYSQSKQKDYIRQMYFYAQFIWWARNIEIDKIFLWYLRENRFEEIPIKHMEILETVKWAEKTISKIKKEKKWRANNTKKNTYFCNQICSVRNFCEYRNEKI